MDNNFFSPEKRNIKKLITELSKVLNVDIKTLSIIEEKLDEIILKSNCLNDMLEKYFSLLENEMITLIEKKITPSFQFGIKNRYFSFIGYTGKFNGLENSIDVDKNTFYSFDSVSKILTSVITMMMIRDGFVTMDSKVNSFNSDFNFDADIRSILNFTACMHTDKRIDYFSREDTIAMLQKCREDLIEKNNFKNYYKYSDIGYMILRLTLPDFLDRLDTVLNSIDSYNLTYKNLNSKHLITGGRLGVEYITPDPKGRGIPFPGHTGLYGNIEGLLNMFNLVFYTDNILKEEELKVLLKQPYVDPVVYDEFGNTVKGENNSTLYMAKIAGIYRKPNNIMDSNYNKINSCDFSNLTTNNAKASAGTCGSWVMGDNLSYNGLFGNYVGGILTNPYSYVQSGKYDNSKNVIANTNLIVNERGVLCCGYSTLLNPYKDIIAKYGILLELLTEYVKYTYSEEMLNKKKITYTRSLKKSL